MGFSPICFNFPFLSSSQKLKLLFDYGAKAPDLPYDPFNSQLKLTAINTPPFDLQPLIHIISQC
jgi:hypothetical protein